MSDRAGLAQSCEGSPPLALYVQMFLMDFMSKANTSLPLNMVIDAEPKGQMTYETLDPT